MKIGTIVKDVKGKIGMIVYKKNNQEIGVNYSHYRIVDNLDISLPEKIERLKLLGTDEMYCKEELTEIKGEEK